LLFVEHIISPVIEQSINVQFYARDVYILV